MKNDRELYDEIVARLAADSRADTRTNAAERADRIVTVCGQIDIDARAPAGENAADGDARVLGIDVAVHVAIPGSATRADLELVVAAREALAAKPLIPPDAIKVSVCGGGLTLTGQVEWACQRWAAIEAVSTLPGVCGVADRIVVSPRVLSEEVKANIRAALDRCACGENTSIDVSIEGTCVKLSGVVDSPLERRTACIAAWTSPGVRRVIADDLRVSP